MGTVWQKPPLSPLRRRFPIRSCPTRAKLTAGRLTAADSCTQTRRTGPTPPAAAAAAAADQSILLRCIGPALDTTLTPTSQAIPSDPHDAVGDMLRTAGCCPTSGVTAPFNCTVSGPPESVAAPPPSHITHFCSCPPNACAQVTGRACSSGARGRQAPDGTVQRC
jgi:hypothetical protein